MVTSLCFLLHAKFHLPEVYIAQSFDHFFSHLNFICAVSPIIWQIQMNNYQGMDNALLAGAYPLSTLSQLSNLTQQQQLLNVGHHAQQLQAMDQQRQLLDLAAHSQDLQQLQYLSQINGGGSSVAGGLGAAVGAGQSDASMQYLSQQMRSASAAGLGGVGARASPLTAESFLAAATSKRQNIIRAPCCARGMPVDHNFEVGHMMSLFLTRFVLSIDCLVKPAMNVSQQCFLVQFYSFMCVADCLL